MGHLTRPHRDLTRMLAFASAENEGTEPEATSEDLTIPGDLSVLSDSELATLHADATATFKDLYNGGNVSAENFETLSTLTDGLEALSEEMASRENEAQERAEKAAAFAERAGVKLAQESEESDSEEPGEEQSEDESEEEGDETPSEDETEGEAEGEIVEGEEPVEGKPVRKSIRVSRGMSRSMAARNLPEAPSNEKGVKRVLRAAQDGFDFSAGQGLDWDDAGRLLDSRLTNFSANQYAMAARNGQHLRKEIPLLTIQNDVPEKFRIDSLEGEAVEKALTAAASEVKENALTASGGWCAPSETMYDLLELETTEGIFTMPEVVLNRGGINRTLGPDFSELFSDITGWNYTEEQDIAGNYGVDANGNGNDTEGTKPCYVVDCPPFEEYRLGVAGLCISAGLLMQRGYPEVIARTIRGALVAHRHRMSARFLGAIAAGSTKVDMPNEMAGLAAPVLSQVELQIEWFRTKERMSRRAAVEVVLPLWVRGAIRADLALRSGTDLQAVTDAQIASWFRERGATAQFVYNFQDIDTTKPLTEWPTEIKFLIYPAGTWIKGTSPIITMTNIYDNLSLGTNDYTALFTEEGWVVIPMGRNSHLVTMQFCANGAAAAAIALECDGSIAAPALGGASIDDVGA